MGVTAERVSRLPEGVTYRQLDYWASLGYLLPVNGGNPGSGRGRQWPAAEIRVAETIARLRRAGLDLPAAARVARAAAARRPAELAPGITVMIAPEDPVRRRRARRAA